MKKRNNNLCKEQKSEHELIRLKNAVHNKSRLYFLGLMPLSPSFGANNNKHAENEQKRRHPKRKKEKYLDNASAGCKCPTRSSS